MNVESIEDRLKDLAVWRDEVPPPVADMGDWDEGWDDEAPPIVVNMGNELGEGWDDDVPPMATTMGEDAEIAQASVGRV